MSGPVESGELTPGNIMQMKATEVIGTDTVIYHRAGYTAISGGSTSSEGCVLTSKTVAVDLGNMSVDHFKQVGALGTLHSIDASFSCTTEFPLKFKLNATYGVSSTTGSVLKLDGSEGSASGIGIQVLYNSKPVTFNTTYEDTATNTSTRDLDLKARYYQLDSKVLPGKVSSTMTLTIIYS